MDKLERQIVRYRKKLIDKAKQDKTLSSDYFAAVAGEEPDEKLAIQRVKKIAMKPMDPEEACLQMELLGHNFFMFKNAETGAVNVVYKRNEAGTYGLIEADE
ncbi:MAG: sigma 54 modulation/S30EA ribosomal C-terminal domain-containing protein [Clostridia bacterium]